MKEDALAKDLANIKDQRLLSKYFKAAELTEVQAIIHVENKA